MNVNSEFLPPIAMGQTYSDLVLVRIVDGTDEVNQNPNYNNEDIIVNSSPDDNH